MVRSPALEVISYLKKTDFSKPATRYLYCILWKHKHLFSPWHGAHCFWHRPPRKMCFVNLDKWFRWVERHWEDDVSLPRHSLLLYTGMAGAAHSWWWVKARLRINKCFILFFLQEGNPYLISSVFLFLKTQPTSGWRTARSCCPHLTTLLALISPYRPSNGYAISESQMSTSSPRFVQISIQVRLLAQNLKEKKILTHCHNSVPKSVITFWVC